MENTLSKLTDSLKNYVVAPLNAFGVGGLVFDVGSDTIASLTSDITDHYAEDNKALQDHIAIRPKRITLRGYVGELVYRPEGNEVTFPQKVTQKLTVVNSYLPALSSAAQQVQEVIRTGSIEKVTLTGASDIYSLVKNSLSGAGEQTQQQNAYNYFRALQEGGILLGIQTPWEFLSNMAVESIVAIQGEATKYVSDFAVTFKQIRFASTKTLAFTAIVDAVKQGASALQSAAEVAVGQVQGLDLPSSQLPSIQSTIGGAVDLKRMDGISKTWELIQ